MDRLLVICTNNFDAQDVMFIKGKKEDAEMTTNWSKVVNLAGIKEGAMCVFTFYNGRDGFICLLFASTEVNNFAL